MIRPPTPVLVKSRIAVDTRHRGEIRQKAISPRHSVYALRPTSAGSLDAPYWSQITRRPVRLQPLGLRFQESEKEGHKEEFRLLGFNDLLKILGRRFVIERAGKRRIG